MPSGACSRIQARSCRPNAVPVTIRKRSSASRVIVKSHSIPPRWLSICVYVIAPTSRATLLSHNRSRKSAASSPEISILAKDVSSKSAAGDVLRSDRRRPQATGPAARPQRLVAQSRVGFKPVHAFPAGLLSEDATERLRARVGRRHQQRASRLAFVPRILDVVVRRVDLDRARERVFPAFV